MSQTRSQLINPIDGNINVTGIVTSNTFVGQLNSSGVSTVANLISININATGISTVANLRSTNINAIGIVTANTFIGQLNSSGVSTISNLRSTNINATGIVTSSTVNDSKGDVRIIPQNTQTSAYILAVSDVGKHVAISTGGVTVNSGIFSAGDAVSIYNNSGSNQTITQGTSVTMYQAGTANTGNRTLAQRGICTILCVGSNIFVISGAGMS
jgi:hypothetical protein